MDSLFAGGAPALTAAYFDVWILRLSGLFPSLAECARCGVALPAEGALSFDESLPGFLGPECKSGAGVRLSAPARRTLARISLGSPGPEPRNG